MKIISFITKAQPEVIRRILEYLDLWQAEKPREIRPPPGKTITNEPFDDGWPGFSEPYIVRN